MSINLVRVILFNIIAVQFHANSPIIQEALLACNCLMLEFIPLRIFHEHRSKESFHLKHSYIERL